MFHVSQVKAAVQPSNEGSSTRHPPQSAFTCSNLTIETLEQSVKYVQS